MEQNLLLLLLVLILIVVGLLIYSISAARKTSRTTKKNEEYEHRFSKIISIEKEIVAIEEKKTNIEKTVENLQSSYKTKKVIFDDLVKKAAIYNEEIELAELGFYKPHYDFDVSEQYKDQIELTKFKQKQMIANKTAISCSKQWLVEGSESKGRAMTNKLIKLIARAFNTECDVAASNVRWNNVERMEQRIRKAFSAINKLNESYFVSISSTYLDLKVDELRLIHEYKEKKQHEKEEQAEIKRQMREETKLLQESEKAQKEEDKYKNMLEKAKAEAEQATGNTLARLQEKIATLDSELEDAHSKNERAKSMAQQTRSGHVYVISNIGSFGENIYKIGMTRRLEPLDRVKELGDASVPFVFDVHAMVYSDDAPTLEKELHKKFNWERVNLVNGRKEYFNVTLGDIEDAVSVLAPDADFVQTSEAREFRESQAIRSQRQQSRDESTSINVFPEAI